MRATRPTTAPNFTHSPRSQARWRAPQRRRRPTFRRCRHGRRGLNRSANRTGYWVLGVGLRNGTRHPTPMKIKEITAMVRRKIGSTLAACGIVMLLFGMSALPALGAAPSPVRMAPSPRPALAPEKGSSDTVLMGHITGTVIDLTSGAPSAGVAVRVGGALVWSDANGT